LFLFIMFRCGTDIIDSTVIKTGPNLLTSTILLALILEVSVVFSNYQHQP
jgi:hypothetical protein